MTSENATLLGSFIQAAATIAIGLFVFIAGLYFGRRQRARRKVIEYDVSATNLADASNVINSPIKISIDKAILTGKKSDHGNLVSIHNATAFFIRLRNIGNETIENPSIEIKLEEKSIIIQSETEPKNRPGYEVVIQRNYSERNVIHVTPSYINSKDTFTITIISVDNEKYNCDVKVFGRDINNVFMVSRENSTIDRLTNTIRFLLTMISILAIFSSIIGYIILFSK
jgi:hypothetical protein